LSGHFIDTKAINICLHYLKQTYLYLYTVEYRAYRLRRRASTSEQYTPNIGYTVIYRIIALGSSAGKTSLGERVVEGLRRKGVVVAVIKQTHEPQIDPGSDPGRYWTAGANVVIVSSPEETTVFMESEHDLRNLVMKYMPYHPLVIVEGFRGVNVGKAIAIIENEEELQHLAKEPGLWFIVSHDFDLVSSAKEMGLNALLFEEVDALVGEIFKDSIQTLSSLMKPEDCRKCGFGSCIELAERILRMEIQPIDCPILSRGNIIVNDRVLHLDPCMQTILKNLVRGFLASIEGVPSGVKKIRIEIELG